MNRNDTDFDPSSSVSHRGWWNRPGWEQCPSCRGSYNLEVEIHCVHCDSPLCPLCAVVLREPAVSSERIAGSVRHSCSACCEESGTSGEEH